MVSVQEISYYTILYILQALKQIYQIALSSLKYVKKKTFPQSPDVLYVLLLIPTFFFSSTDTALIF